MKELIKDCLKKTMNDILFCELVLFIINHICSMSFLTCVIIGNLRLHQIKHTTPDTIGVNFLCLLVFGLIFGFLYDKYEYQIDKFYSKVKKYKYNYEKIS